MWDPQWDAFPPAHRTVRYDLRGFGRSPLPPQPYSHARDLIALLERLGVQQATLVGASLGGRVALEAAVMHPEVVDALILAGAALPGFAWSDELRAFWGRRTPPWSAAIWTPPSRSISRCGSMARADRPPRLIPRCASRFAGCSAVPLIELQLPVWEDAEEELLVPDLARRLSAVRPPTLVVVGAEDVPDFQQIATQLARGIPSAQLAVVPNAAHLPSLERPAAFNELALRFLARDDSW
jgi:3-oxoadipate enol-lactonase